MAAAFSGDRVRLLERHTVREIARVALRGDYFNDCCTRVALGVATATELTLVTNQLELGAPGGDIQPTRRMARRARDAVGALYRRERGVDESFAPGSIVYVKNAELHKGIADLEGAIPAGSTSKRSYSALDVVWAARLAHALRVPPVGFDQLINKLDETRLVTASRILQEYDQLVPQFSRRQRHLLARHYPAAYNR